MFKSLARLAASGLGFLAPFKAWILGSVGLAVVTFLAVTFLTLRNDRDQLERFATMACATAGAELAASAEPVRDAKGKVRSVKFKRGDKCQIRIAELATFERDAKDATNRALAGALVEHKQKSEADAATASQSAAKRAVAERKMKETDDAIAEDHVASDWFDALNGLGGLRRPETD